MIFNQKAEKNNKSSNKPPNPYFLFCQDRRVKLQNENPQMPSREITKLLAQEWKNLSDIEKSRYNEKYKASLENMQRVNLKKPVPHNIFGDFCLRLTSMDGTVIQIPALISPDQPFRL